MFAGVQPVVDIALAVKDGAGGWFEELGAVAGVTQLGELALIHWDVGGGFFRPHAHVARVEAGGNAGHEPLVDGFTLRMRAKVDNGG